MKSLGRWCNSTLSDQGQVDELKEFIVKAISITDKTFLPINSTDKTFLPGKLKLWCLLFGLLRRMWWPFTVCEVAVVL